MVTVTAVPPWSSGDGQRDAAGHAPRGHQERVLAGAARHQHPDVARFAGHRQPMIVGCGLHPLGPRQLLEVTAERGRGDAGVFSPDEAAEVTLDVMRNASNKIAVAMAADAPRVEQGTERYRILADGKTRCE